MAYNVVETTKITGSCFDFLYTNDIENGSVVGKGALVTGERNIYTATVPAVGDEVFLVANPAWSYDDSRAINQNEDAFINKANKPFRTYGLVAHNHDKFGVMDYGITPVNDSTPVAVGDYVTVDGTTNKLADAGTTKPADTYGFIGQIVEIENYGFAFNVGTAGVVDTTGKKVIIEVIKNETV